MGGGICAPVICLFQCLCLYACVRAHLSIHECVCACVRACVCVCVRECVCACVRACVRVRVGMWGETAMGREVN